MRNHAATGSRKSRREARADKPARSRGGRHFSSSHKAAPTTAVTTDEAVAAPASADLSPVGDKQRRSWSWPARLGVTAGVVVLMGAVAVGLVFFLGKPKVSVTGASGVLADVHVSGLGTKVATTTATVDGQRVQLLSSAGGLVPDRALPQGQSVTVTVSASAPSWLSWLFGSPVSASTTVHTPSAAPTAKVAVAAVAGQVQLRFDHPVSIVRYSFDGQAAKLIHLAQPTTLANLSVPANVRGGSLVVAASPAGWEQISTEAATISYFVAPPGGGPVALVTPAPGSSGVASNAPVTMTFDEPVSQVLGSSRPTLSPAVPGTWSEPASNTLTFTPSGFGYGPGAVVTVSFGRPVSAVSADELDGAATTAAATDQFTFDVGASSDMRMEQILADLHYLPLTFTPAAGSSQPTTFAGQVAAMTDPVPGTFSWRWSTTPSALMAKWTPGQDNELLKGALMAFLSNEPGYDGYLAEPATVAQLSTNTTWQELIQAAVAGKTDPSAYSYVYVTESRPETLTLWENGSVVLTSAANTGIPGRETALGTYPIYVRYVQNYMDGTNPDGSKYHDLVHWINYFSGGDAVHGFVRGSYGYPQSLGCVELPVSIAETAFGELAVGDLVTVNPA